MLSKVKKFKAKLENLGFDFSALKLGDECNADVDANYHINAMCYDSISPEASGIEVFVYCNDPDDVEIIISTIKIDNPLNRSLLFHPYEKNLNDFEAALKIIEAIVTAGFE